MIKEDAYSATGNILQNERQEPQLLQHGPSALGFSDHPQASAHQFSQGEGSQAEHRRSTR